MVENAPATGRLRLLAELRIHADIAELELLFGRETPGALEQYRSLILRGQLAHAMNLTIHIVRSWIRGGPFQIHRLSCD
jgi:hypothetical protein